MANLPETSFMPQQPLLRVEGGARRSEPLNLALVVAIIVFFVTLSVAGGVYFYKTKLDKEILAKGQELANKEKNFNVDDITAFKNLQTTLATAKQLVDSHTIFSALLDLIEAHAAENVGLTAFDYKNEGSLVKVAVSGQAPSYAAAYFQVEEWRKTPYVKNVDVTAITLDERTAIVAFSAQIDIDSSLLNFSRVLQAEAQNAVKIDTNNKTNTISANNLPLPNLPLASSSMPVQIISPKPK